MAEKKFAFESGKVSIAFSLILGLGDSVVARKVFDALIELAPNSVVDIFGFGKNHLNFAKAFYGDSKNLNGIFLRDENFQQVFQKYDLVLYPHGCDAVVLEWVNPERLKNLSPALLEGIAKVEAYNKLNVYNRGAIGLNVTLRNMLISRILDKNTFEFLSCGGALPIRDDKVNIPLYPEFKPQFDALKLDKYITIYSDIDEKEKNLPKVKTWPIRCLNEYVARMKKRFPAVEIVQCGGGDIKIGNADRHYLGVDLELTKYILANSLLHVGGEGGLIHLATALGTKCLVLFGSTVVEYFGYKQNINLVSEVCTPCHDILAANNICLRGNREPPCMLAHTPKTVCEVTCNYLKNKI